MSLKLKSALAALMLTASLAASSLPAAAFAPPAPAQKTVSTEAGDPVRVVVVLKSDSLIEQFDSDSLGTEETAGAADTIAAQQKRVQRQIRSFYPALEVGASYDVLINGFSCTLPAELIPQVEALQAVEAVRLLPQVQIPQMANAPALSGVPAFQQETGCTGEGQVIAVIDSELCTDHPMFAALPDSVGTKLSKDDITEIIGKNVLHKDLDPDKTYLSSKLPYVIDYVDDPYEGVPNPVDYHGTHVSGIAAGNEIVTDSGRTVSGIAKDAQIVFMGVGSGHGFVDSEAALLALEDAVVLHADVINMSWGSLAEYYDENIFSDVFTAADNAGISICISAGNADNGVQSLGRKNYPENPDVSTIDDKTVPDSCAFVVASADNNTTYQGGVLLLGDQEIFFLPFYEQSLQPDYMTDHLRLGDFEYVDCGQLRTADLKIEQTDDLTGKLMLIDRGLMPLSAVYMAARLRNAAGVLLVDDIADNDQIGGMFEPLPDVPTAVLSTKQGEMLRAAKTKVVTNPGTTVEKQAENKVSFYTSWGTSHSLDLRPDITGIGGSVESAAYGGSTEVMSGTSMASPYVAGCTALIRQYLKQQGVDEEGTELLRHIRALMMNTAVPYEENGLLVSPRRQGAGQVNLERAVQSKVLLTDTRGDGKVNLLDKNGDSFSFEVELRNLSSEKVTFSDAKLLLTTDDTEYYKPFRCDIISGQRELKCTADLSALKSIGAGGTKTVTVRVSLDPAQTASISEKFINGFFIDGFLQLTGASNCPDISVPLCGYYGEWVELPVLNPDNAGAFVQYGGGWFSAALPFSESIALIQSIISRAGEQPDNAYYNIFEMAESYASKAENDRLQFGPQDIWLSPNGDSLADSLINVNFEIKRQAKVKYQITDADGKVLCEESDELMPPYNEADGIQLARPRQTLGFKEDMFDWAEGDYNIHADFWINYSEMAEPVQSLDMPFHIDNTAPEVKSEIVTENGRKILKMDISDNRAPDCVFIVGSRSADAPQKQDDQPDALGLLTYYLNLRGGSSSGWIEGPSKPVPYICGLMTKGAKERDSVYDFSDMIPLTPDASGSCFAEYDITDLTDYSVTVLDKAMNFYEIQSEGGAEMQIKEGVWNDQFHGLMEFSGNQVRVADYFDGSVKTYSYTLKDRILTLTSADETLRRELFFRNEREIEYLNEGSDEYGTMSYFDYDKLEEFPFYSVNEMKPKMISLFEARSGKHVTKCEVTVIAPQVANFQLWTEEDSDSEYPESITVNLLNGLGGNRFTNAFSLLDVPCERAEPGIYVSDHHYMYTVFNEDGKTGMFLFFSSDRFIGTREFENLTFTYEIGEHGRTVFHTNEDGDHEGYLMLRGDNGLVVTLEHTGSLDHYRMEDMTPADAENFHSSSELREIFAAYEEAVRGETPDWCGVNSLSEGMANCMSTQGSGFLINPFTLKGFDDNGRPIDLTQYPTLPEGSMTLDEIKAQALQNYQAKTGRTDVKVSGRITPDQKVVVTFYTDDEGVLESFTVEPFPSDVRGDVDCDGRFSIADCVLLARYLAEDPVAVTAQGLINAEADGNPDTLTAGDLTFLMQALAGTNTLK